MLFTLKWSFPHRAIKSKIDFSMVAKELGPETRICVGSAFSLFGDSSGADVGLDLV